MLKAHTVVTNETLIIHPQSGPQLYKAFQVLSASASCFDFMACSASVVLLAKGTVWAKKVAACMCVKGLF